eukprot:scaffold268664_cov27-Prasinocladus_malaysianus.AAC.1
MQRLQAIVMESFSPTKMPDCVWGEFACLWLASAQLLKEAGPEGSTPAVILQQSIDRNLRDWGETQAKSLLISVLSKDRMFVRVKYGVYALVQFHPVSGNPNLSGLISTMHASVAIPQASGMSDFVSDFIDSIVVLKFSLLESYTLSTIQFVRAIFSDGWYLPLTD